MKLRERYRKLTIWNKIAFWGAATSIVGIPLAVGLWMFPVFSPTIAPANIEVTFSPRSAVLGKVLPRLSADGSSAPLQIEVGLKNSGGTRATGAVVALAFRPHLNAQVIAGPWRHKSGIKDYRTFVFEDHQVPVYSGSGRHIGTFQVQLPRRTAAEELLAVFQVHGDFGRKEGLLFYDRERDEYRWSHTSKPNEAFGRWNQHVVQWSAEKE